jgi:F-type H+-transporting ATPase subunit epsilon
MPVALEIVSPERLLLSRPVDMVVMPAYEGDLAAQPGHAPMITLLRGGVVTLYDGMTPTERFFVAGGFAELTPDRCTILADTAVPLSELSISASQQSLAAAEAHWVEVDKMDNTARDIALDRLQSARAAVAVATAA